MQTVADPATHAAGALLLTLSLPADPATLASGVTLTDDTAGALLVEGTDYVALPLPDGPEVLALLPLEGWAREHAYRVTLTTDLADTAGRPLAQAREIPILIPAEGAVTAAAPPDLAVTYDSVAAADATLGGRFPGGQTLLFQGLWTDPTTGLAYARNRWYDPHNAAWLSEDPLGPVDSQNLYAFVGWGPHAATDPMGLQGPARSVVRELELIDLRYDLERRQREAEKYTLAPWVLHEAFVAPVKRAFGWVEEKEEQAVRAAGERAKSGVRTAIPTAEADADRRQIAELTGQQNTAAGGDGAAFRNRLQEETAEIAERGAETSTRVALEVGEDYLLGVGAGRATRMGRAARAGRTARAIDRGHDYERRIRSLYGDTAFRARQFRVFENGQWATRQADNVVLIDGIDVAVEAKYVDEWARSIRNPEASVSKYFWAADEQAKMVGQARTYSNNFDRVIYHTNSQELIDYYTRVFADEGIQGIKFVLTP